MTDPKTNPTNSQVVGALSSAGRERLPYKQEVAGSNPAAPIELTESDGSDSRCLFPLIGLRSGLSAGARGPHVVCPSSARW